MRSSNRRFLPITCIAAAVLSVLAAGGLRAEGEPEGVLAGAADPTIIVAPGDDKGYYVFATGRGLPFYHSTDLVNWRRAGRVFERAVPEWAAEKVPGTGGIWAPHIERIGEHYHLYYSCSTFGKQRSVIGLAVNRALDPQDP
ncbi:MAG: family 43 glycosylhydrolase, partial [Planctomycetes bacterium]|nr:family 43 glycosylhydrolase [Planctomycetota bacterium]